MANMGGGGVFFRPLRSLGSCGRRCSPYVSPKKAGRLWTEGSGHDIQQERV